MESCSLHSQTVTTVPSSPSLSGFIEKPFVHGQLIKFPYSKRYPHARKLKFCNDRAQASGTTKVRSEAVGAGSKKEDLKDENLVFVAGATGRVGSRTVRELLKLGFQVRAGVRSAQRAETLVQSVKQMKLNVENASDGTQPVEKLALVECDLEKQDQIGPALGNASVVICCIGASEKEVFDITGPYRIDYLAAKNLIDAATVAKVKHFVLLTSLGTNKVGFPAAILNLFWGVLIWKRKAEEALLASGLPYTIVRPGGMERPTDAYKETHNITLSQEDTLFGGQVSNLQVAELMAVMAKNRSLSYCKVVEVIAETTAPLIPMEELLAKIPSQRAEIYSPKESGAAGGPGQKPNRKRKDKCVNTVSDVIMKQCRNVLHLAAAADKKMVFGSMLGGSLNISDDDDDDDGLLQSPSMLSRPLDFRIIDMKLTSGAYGGSHDAFLEDVREVWRNIRTACGDQADLIHLAETLSQKFEVLYKKEVLNFVPKLVDNETGGCSSAEAKNKMGDINECARENPKARSDEGVCKLCGVNKDDKNVLLCDTCDSGYHTYCLNPPLAKIPHGNWYCPSCVTGNCITQGSSQSTEVISRFRKKRCQREFNHRFPKALAHLVTTMAMKEYWEYTVEERIFLLKFLCDEVLNSAKIREHLEQCASMSADLQQKLHSLSSEWRNLKLREEVVAAQVGKVNQSTLNGVGNSVTEEVAIVRTSYRKLRGQLLSRSNCMSPFSTNMNTLEDGLGWPVPNDSSKQPCWLYSKSSSEKHSTSSGSQIVKMHDVEFQKNQLSFGKNGFISENSLCHMMPSSEKDTYSRQNMLPFSIPQQQKDKPSGANVTWSNFEGKQDLENGSVDGSRVPYCEFLGGHLSSDTIRTHVAEHVHAVHINSGNLFPSYRGIIQPAVNESQAKNLKASFLKNEITVLQDSIACLESQILKVSLRKDFLGRDSAGRLYWGFSWPGTPPWVVIDGTMLVLQKKIEKQGTSLPGSSTLRCPFGTGSVLSSEGLDISNPYMYVHNDNTTFPWISFQSDTEIEELIQWLRDTHPLERELLGAILQWQNIRYKDSNEAINCVQGVDQPTSSKPDNSEELVNSNAIGASIVLEKKFGACLKSESSIPMKQSWKAEVKFSEKMCRCDCLELIWPSRCHCYSCHQSFSTSEELKRHDNGMCHPSVPTSGNKVNGSVLKGKGMMMTETSLGECSNEIGLSRVSGSVMHEVGVEFNKITEELACPFDIEEISTKFITKDSNKELVQEIGLIGSNGVPSFVPSTSPFLDDPTLKLEPSWKNEGKRGGNSKNIENQLQHLVEGKMKINGRRGKFSINSTRRFAKNGKFEGSMKGVKSSFLKNSDLRVVNCSIIGESSSRPIIGRAVQLLRQLKMNLLDMDAALPEEALKPSMAGLDKRHAWRVFVKSAKSIMEMVQATIVFEEMIKTEYLRNGRQYWSSLSAAARIATISSLALHICTLDASLVYEKPLPSSSPIVIENLGSESDIKILTCSNPLDTPMTSCKPVQKTFGVDLTDNANPSSKRSKKRKDSGG